MGIGMMMSSMRLAGRLIPVILVVVPVCGVVVIMEVGGAGMGEEHPMPRAARPMVNDHMQSRHEKGQDQTQAHHAHARYRLVLWSAILEEQVCPMAPLDTPSLWQGALYTTVRSH